MSAIVDVFFTAPLRNIAICISVIADSAQFPASPNDPSDLFAAA
ncbi:MAG: hypothetical protein VB096_03050 [Pseudoflavonifractor sp.]|nr:hypothetical protein [Pseudoflavonifractor sp.]